MRSKFVLLNQFEKSPNSEVGQGHLHIYNVYSLHCMKTSADGC